MYSLRECPLESGAVSLSPKYIRTSVKKLKLISVPMLLSVGHRLLFSTNFIDWKCPRPHSEYIKSKRPVFWATEHTTGFTYWLVFCLYRWNIKFAVADSWWSPVDSGIEWITNTLIQCDDTARIASHQLQTLTIARGATANFYTFQTIFSGDNRAL